MGFDVDNPVYHGTASDVKAFDLNKAGSKTDSGWYGKAVYLTEDPKQAGLYAGEGEGANVLKVLNKKLNFYDVEAGTPMSMKEVQRIKDEGFEGIRVFDKMEDGLGVGKTQETVVFDPKNIRSVNAKFDPSKANSADIMALRAPLAVSGAGGAAAYALSPQDAKAQTLTQDQQNALIEYRAMKRKEQPTRITINPAAQGTQGAPDVQLPATIPDQSSLTQQNEGLRLSTYTDTEGNPTVGYGFNFNSGIAPKVWKQSGLASYKRLADVKAGRDTITPQEAQALYQTSYQIADNDARQYFKGYEKLAEGQKTALRDMAYQFGLPNLKKMRSLHNALQKGDKNAIVNAIRNSEYGRKYQDRARQITNLLVGDA
jgi:GH24 family phage-related lysozyme (muramidase)